MKKVGSQREWLQKVPALSVLAFVPLNCAVASRADEAKPPVAPPAPPATITKAEIEAMEMMIPPFVPPISDKRQKTAQQHLDLSMVEMIAQSPISIDVQDVSLEELVEAIEKAAKKPIKPKVIDIRTDEPVMVSLKVEEMALGKVMSAAAALAGCHLYLLPDRFVIGAYTSLSEEEKFVGERYSRDVASYGKDRSRLFASEIMKNHHDGNNGDKTRLKLTDLSKSEQQMVQWMADDLSQKTNNAQITLPISTEIVIETTMEGFNNFRLNLQSINRGVGGYDWFNVRR